MPYLSDGTYIDPTDTAIIDLQLEKVHKALVQYEDLLCDMDNFEYVARGNGFCDSKYSEDFIIGQINKLKQTEAELESLKDNH